MTKIFAGDTAHLAMACFVSFPGQLSTSHGAQSACQNAPSPVTCSRHQQSTTESRLSKAKGSPAKRVRAKRRPESNLLNGNYGSADLPLELLQELRRFLKGYRFGAQIAEMANCRVAKFSGIIFAKQPISSTCPDGFPPAMVPLKQRSDLEIVGIPPTLVEHAASVAKIILQGVSKTHLCAVFEKYGPLDAPLVDGDYAKRREEDIMIQMESWCDFGESFRTETDMLHPDGPELFVESLSDMMD